MVNYGHIIFSHKWLLILKKLTLLNPIIYASFPVLFFYSVNIAELQIRYIITPLLAAIILSILCFGLLTVLLKNWYIGSFMSSILMIIFFSYGHLVQYFKFGLTVGPLYIGPNKSLTLIFLAIIAPLAAKVTSIDEDKLLELMKFLFIAALTLILFSSASIGYYEAFKRRGIHFNSATTSIVNTKKSQLHQYPDIYYIILDQYASSKTLAEYFGAADAYDLSSFLEKHDFYLASESRSNYPVTYLSLPSSLNMDYLDHLIPEMDNKSSDRTGVYSLLQDHRVGTFLKERGYKYIHSGNWWEPTRVNTNADINTARVSILNNEFNQKFLRTTALTILMQKLNLFSSASSINLNERSQTLSQIAEFEKVSKIKGPKFVLAHLALPHDPFVFNRDGGMVDKPLKWHTLDSKEKDAYLEQVSYTNHVVMSLISTLLGQKEDPVIVVQSDHGPPGAVGIQNLWMPSENQPEMLAIQMNILNAYYLPGADNRALYGAISPVNTFRVIFNQYFGTSYPLLSDRSFVPRNDRQIYDLIEVTGKF